MIKEIKEITKKGKEEISDSKSCCSPTCCTSDAVNVTEVDTQDGVDLKRIVKEKYGDIALTQSSCCSADSDFNVKENYDGKEGYFETADLNLGCGLPTEYAQIKKGDTVLDLGAGAGNDVFVASQLVGTNGKVIGVDMTKEMVELANKNKAKLKLDHVEFLLGEIEVLPIKEASIDVVISNCVMNLVPDKLKAYQEVFRVLKPGGHFSISDIVIDKELPPSIQEKAELYVGCVAGAMVRANYLDTIHQAGFQKVEILKERIIKLPEAVLEEYLTIKELKAYNESQSHIYSITVFAKK